MLGYQLKIGLATDAFPPTTDGITLVAENYAKYINQNHGECVVITPYDPHAQDENYPYPIYRYQSWPYQPKEGYRIGWPFKQKFRQEIRQMNFDLLHSHCPLASSYFMKLVTQEHKIPQVFTYHTKYEYDIEKRVPTQWGKQFFKDFICRNIEPADEVWTISEGAAESLRNIGYTGPYRIMPNGVDFPKGKADPSLVEQISRRHGLSRECPVFLYAGRMMWYKNLGMTLEALRRLKDQGIQFQFLMVGIGADANGIRRLVKKLDLSREVIFTGKILDRELLRAYYSRADLFLFPSTFDTNGLVVREAAACECPSILTRGSCAAEGIDDGISGYLCEENPEDMAHVIRRILKDPAGMQKVGRTASDKIYLSWEDATAMAYRRYEEICAAWPHPLPYREKAQNE